MDENGRNLDDGQSTNTGSFRKTIQDTRTVVAAAAVSLLLLSGCSTCTQEKAQDSVSCNANDCYDGCGNKI